MTVNDDIKNNQDEESSDDSYWRTYFEDETVSMDTYRTRVRMACEHGNQQKSQTTQRLDNTKEKQTSKKISSVRVDLTETIEIKR